MLEYKYENFYEAIEHNAKVSPSKSVIFIEDRKVDNLRFKQKIDTFSRFLEFSGIKSRDKVALIVGNSEEFMVSLFAITTLLWTLLANPAARHGPPTAEISTFWTPLSAKSLSSLSTNNSYLLL